MPPDPDDSRLDHYFRSHGRWKWAVGSIVLTGVGAYAWAPNLVWGLSIFALVVIVFVFTDPILLTSVLVTSRARRRRRRPRATESLPPPPPALPSTAGWPDRTPEVLLLLQSDASVGRRAVDWAIEALEAGFDTTSLRILAGEDIRHDPANADVEPLIRDALGELAIVEPDFEVTARLYVRDVARAVLEGELRPIDAAALVHARVLAPLNHPHDLMPWCYASDGIAPDTLRRLEEHEIDDEIRRVAAGFAGPRVSGEGLT